MKKLVYLIGALALVGCAQTSQQNEQEPEVYEVKPSFLAAEIKQNKVESSTVVQNQSQEAGSGFERLKSIEIENRENRLRNQTALLFSDKEMVELAADNMPMSEFLHYVFGEILTVNYVLSPELKADPTLVTLNIQESVSKRRLYNLAVQLLSQNQVTLDYNEDVFFVQKSELGKAKAVIGVGGQVSSVPVTSGQILQVIPIRFGIKLSLERTVRELIDGVITPDFEQSALFVLGDRPNVLRAIELVNMLDVPANKGKHIALLSLRYVSVESFVEQVGILMNNEGISIGVNNEANRSASLVPLNNIGAIAVFANTDEILNRVKYWVSVLDKPAKGESKQYFVYNPRYARATDLGKSIGELLTLGTRAPIVRSRRSTGANATELATEDNTESNLVSTDTVSFVVDELSNSIIFSTTGTEYQKLYPLLERLDVLPKQVLLEVMIAEVTMTGEFKFGVEFALNQQSDFTLSTLESFGQVGGLALNYVNGDSRVVGSFFQKNQLVNVLSNPTLLVRDGTQANISIGTDIPVQGGTIVADNGTQTTSIEYRKTGVNVQVTPTINAQGVVIMEISQNISNTVATDTTTSTPSIFERSLTTEAVVESGQTVLLGGLIDENDTIGSTQVPLLGDIPLLGNLFKGKSDTGSKTELVMMVTPRVVYNGDQWEKLLVDFEKGLQNIRLQ